MKLCIHRHVPNALRDVLQQYTACKIPAEGVKAVIISESIPLDVLHRLVTEHHIFGYQDEKKGVFSLFPLPDFLRKQAI